MEWLRALADHRLTLVTPEPTSDVNATSLDVTGVEVQEYPLSRARMAFGAVRAVLAGRPAQEGLYHQAAARRALRRALSSASPDVVVVQMVRCWWALSEIAAAAPGRPVVFDAIDAMGLHFGRGAGDLAAPLRPFARLEAARCRRFEVDLARAAAVTTAVSRRDLEAIGVGDGCGRVVPVSAPERRHGAVSESPVVLLSGNLGYRPTVNGAIWFAKSVWPLIRARVSKARWVVAGARPPRAVRKLAELAGVEVHADVPDLAPFFARARVAIAPMASGSGVPMKVLEAWAAGVPVVAHSWSAAGLEAVAGSDLVTAEGCEEFADAVVGLMLDGEHARAVGDAGRDVWRRLYHPRRVAEAVRAAVTAALAGPTR
jgi:glycosyltransferase involved in cell wall biosynthesis